MNGSSVLLVGTTLDGIEQGTLEAVNFLPQLADHAAFMLLDHTRFGRWFFTPQLSGCEIWIGHDHDPNHAPLLIYITTSGCENEQNPGEREELGTIALERYNNETGQQYDLVHRIIRNNSQIYPASKQYFDDFHNRFLHVRVSVYDATVILFGEYQEHYTCNNENAVHYGGWRFLLRDSERRHFFELGESCHGSIL